MKQKQYTSMNCQCGKQKGIALFTVMIFLLILTVIGLSSMQTSRLEQMMSGNMQWSNIAFQTAELGLTNSIKNTDWGNIVENNSVSTDDYGGSAKNVDYDAETYHVSYTALNRVSKNAWSVKKMRKANFKTTSNGQAKVETTDNTGDVLARAVLEEGLYLLAPK